MNNKIIQIDKHNSLIIVAGHAIWNRKWYGGFADEDYFYEAHIRAGLELLGRLRYAKIVFSGGRTRPKLESKTRGLSEAEGMMKWAAKKRLCAAGDHRVLLENWARDSFENLFFSLLLYAKTVGRWPKQVGVVSWNSKALRYHLIASGLSLGGRIFFHGVGDYPKQLDLERACAAEARFNASIVDTSCVPPAYKLIDPLLRNETEFAMKRWSRMPSRFTADRKGNDEYLECVKQDYATTASIRELIGTVESAKPGDTFRHIRWPW